MKNVVGCWYTFENLVSMPAVVNKDISNVYIGKHFKGMNKHI